MIWPIAIIVGSLAGSIAIVTVAALRFAERVEVPDHEQHARGLERKAFKIQNSWVSGLWTTESEKLDKAKQYIRAADEIRRRGESK